ncbi:hypothetical protein GF325_17460 [Candidatus Bathyarchaeota archaeon]|nr:hypothetical protein [Candidatus Bathyarchaeota archaeon]
MTELVHEEGIEQVTLESDIETGEETPRFFPLRMGFFTLMFLIFFAISVLLLNVIAFFFPGNTGDIFEDIIDWIGLGIETIGLGDMYEFMVPTEDEALYISACIVLSFLSISLLSMKKRGSSLFFKHGTFKRAIVQILVFFGLFILYMQILKLASLFIPGMSEGSVAIYVLIAGASMWIFFQSWALFTAARRAGTSIENKLLAKRNRSGSVFVAIAPYLAATWIVLLTIGFFYFIDVLTGMAPEFALEPWAATMIQIIAFLVVILCIIPSLIAFTVKDSRQKRFDSMVVLMSIVFMYPYLLFNFVIYFLLPKTGVDTGSVGGEDIIIFGIELSQLLIWVELIFTLVLLIMSLRSVGNRTNYQFGKFKKHSFIMFIYASLAGQFGIRYLQTKENLPEFSGVGEFLLDGQYIIINFFMILALILSILLFSSDRFGLYFRVHEEVSKEDRKRIEYIHEQMKMEYNKHSGPFLVSGIYEDLTAIMKIDKLKVMDLVEKTHRRFDDMEIDGLKKRYVCFDFGA